MIFGSNFGFEFLGLLSLSRVLVQLHFKQYTFRVLDKKNKYNLHQDSRSKLSQCAVCSEMKVSSV